jgi:hypothetical protein
VDFVAVDVMSDREGYEQLVKLGVRRVPVVARGDAFVFGQNLEAVAEFVGLRGTGHTPLPPEALVVKWTTVLRAAQRYVRQIPTERLDERAVENRDRSIRVLGHHTFRIAEAFLECVTTGVEFSMELADLPAPDGSCTTGEEIAAYAGGVIERLPVWWNTIIDRSCVERVETFYGPQTQHEFLERCTWHSAQHVRQLIAVLQRYGIAADGPLTDDDLAGLPLPQRLFE